MRLTLLAVSLMSACFAATSAAEPMSAPSSSSVKELAVRVRNSIVVITFAGREGRQQGLGTGFIISKDGLIATNLHVIGEARPISVQTADGKSLKVESVHASDRALDLAVLRVDAKDLPALELGDSEQVQPGEAIVVMGNPHGLKHSVVSGVVSGRREIDGRRMMQLAIPVEPGNSGGPVLDLAGRVLGIVTMKSLVTENLGFAVELNALKPLLEKPNTVAIDRWLTIGAVDAHEWQPLFGARWQQRAGRILVDGLGAGFGGRSLLLAQSQPPELPYELAVSVKMSDESGAAGLIFHADGGDKHYGFYPSNGKLRLSRFEGPDVFSWQVLEEKPSEAYHAGDWNRLKVRVEKDKLRCFVNDELVFESADRGFTSGRVGLAKFRTTGAEFRRFAVAKEIASERSAPEQLAKIVGEIDKLPPLAEVGEAQIRSLVKLKAGDTQAVLLARADQLQSQARELTLLAADVRLQSVLEEFERLAGPNVEKIDLLRAALTIARLDDEHLEVEPYLAHVGRMVDDIRKKLPEKADEAARLAALTEYLFKDNGYHGSRTDYYHRANSYISRVIDDREGLPITLSVLFIELGSRLGLTIEGVGLPSHFVVRHVPAEGEPQLIDVFEGATLLTREQAEKKVLEMTGEPPLESHFRAVTSRQILQRMLTNLLATAQNPQTGPDREAILRYTSAILVLDPAAIRDRGLRAVCRWETGRRDAAVADLQVLIDAQPEGLDVDELRKMQEVFRTEKPGR